MVACYFGTLAIFVIVESIINMDFFKVAIPYFKNKFLSKRKTWSFRLII